MGKKYKPLTDEELYAKYKHILPGSIQQTEKGTIIKSSRNTSIISKGRICIIKCIESDFNKECLKTRVINIQDVKQVIRCDLCVKRNRNRKAYEKKKLKSL